MDKTQLLALISALYLLDVNARAAYIKEAAKKLGIEGGTLFKELKDTGYNPKAEKGAAPPAYESAEAAPQVPQGPPPLVAVPPDTDGVEKTTITARHKTEYTRYRRAGIILTQQPAAYTVTAEQLALLAKDPWVAIEGGGAA